MTPAVLATALVLATSAARPDVVLDCSAFQRLSNGTWFAVAGTQVEIRDRERRTSNMFAIPAATRSSTRADPKPKPRDDVCSLVDQLHGDFDFVEELEGRCR